MGVRIDTEKYKDKTLSDINLGTSFTIGSMSFKETDKNGNVVLRSKDYFEFDNVRYIVKDEK